jgi:hypothetical protein
MNKPVPVLLFFICRLFSFSGENSCSCQPLAAGEVMDTIRVRSDRQESYALYLPPGYNTHSPCPVIYFFEPGGRGSLPLQMYKDLAGEYGFILISSNNCRNGAFEVMAPIAGRLFEDTQSRFSIDTGHVYFSGFSGGSKLAFRLALKNPIVGAVIGCGACYPVAGMQKNSINFIYSGIVGTCDMNYYAMNQNKNMLDNLGVPYYLIYFEGSHTWPPAPVFNEALWWTMIRDGLKGAGHIPDLYSIMSSAADSARKRNDPFSAYQRAMEMKRMLRETAYGIKADSLVKDLQKDPMYTMQMKELARISKIEAATYGEITEAFRSILNTRYNLKDTVHTSSWWKSQYKQCCKLISSNTPEKQKLGKRMDALIVNSSYEQGAGYMSDKDYKRGALVYDILVLFRPESSYGYLQLARCFKAMNQLKKAEKYLEIARKKGLSADQEQDR